VSRTNSVFIALTNHLELYHTLQRLIVHRNSYCIVQRDNITKKMPRRSFRSTHAAYVFINVAMMVGSISAFSTCIHPMKRTPISTLLAHQNRQQSPLNYRPTPIEKTKPFLIDQLPCQPKVGNLLTRTLVMLTIMMAFPLLPSNAGLLDEYGGGLTITAPTSKPGIIEPKASTTTSGNVQIDPTLRGCKFAIYLLLHGKRTLHDCCGESNVLIISNSFNRFLTIVLCYCSFRETLSS
jgi:hypothetical protein